MSYERFERLNKNPWGKDYLKEEIKKAPICLVKLQIAKNQKEIL